MEKEDRKKAGGEASGAECVAVKSYLTRGWYLVHICNEVHDKRGGRLLENLLGSSHLFNAAPGHTNLDCVPQRAMLCCAVSDF